MRRIIELIASLLLSATQRRNKQAILHRALAYITLTLT
ncbi:hypothetical protein P20495_3726 [Pseudoalteromonas sp. BSi20495]|nr:hypothetical protein P20495_3726 [Pseudoalteromonas sp. BSi20495]